jgi:hypothetical protein
VYKESAEEGATKNFTKDFQQLMKEKGIMEENLYNIKLTTPVDELYCENNGTFWSFEPDSLLGPIPAKTMPNA